MARIVVIGSVASDEVVHLTERLREGAHLNGRVQGVRLGGGGANSAVALAAAGHATSLVTAVGSDEAGAWQLRELQAAGIDVAGVVRLQGPSTRSICLIDPEGERTIVNLGRVQEPEPPTRVLAMPAELVYVRTRAVGLAPLLAQVAERATVVAHVPPIEDGVFPAHMIVCSASDLGPAALADPLAMARRVAGEALRWVVVTRGPHGAEALSVDGERLAAPAPKVLTVDSVGAGDAFAAGLCHAVALGAVMEAALKTGVRWGAAKVARHGSALTREAVRALLD
jgi:sugar/nucleoside kinase (ribokinase family)